MYNKLIADFHISYEEVSVNNIHSDKSYVFKVSFVEGVWRKIQIPSEFSLDVLHLAIIKSYNFEDDHLYAFFMDNVLWSLEKVYWPRVGFYVLWHQICNYLNKINGYSLG